MKNWVGTVITTNLKHLLNSEWKLSPHEVQVSYSYSASYVIVTMSHNSTSPKQLLLFWQNFTWREYEAPSTTRVFYLVLMFKQVYGRPGPWLINAINFSFPCNHCRIWTKSYGNRRLLKISLYFLQIYPQIWPPWSLIIRCILDFCSETVVWISTKLYRKLVFLLVQPNNYTIALVSYWLTRFNVIATAARILTKC